MHWKKNLFKLPSGVHGKRFVTEINKLINDWNLNISLESFSIKAAIALPPLLRQKPSKSSKTREHDAALERRLTLWQDSIITEKLDEAIAI